MSDIPVCMGFSLMFLLGLWVGYSMCRQDTASRVAEMEEAMAHFLEFVESAPVGTGVCCCGDDMARHIDAYSAGHTPVDEWDYQLKHQRKALQSIFEGTKHDQIRNERS